MIRWITDTLAYITEPNAELERLMDASFQRVPGLLQWRVPYRGLVDKALEFGSTIASGFASDEVVAKRREACFSCPARMLDKRGNSYCSGCTCGRWMLADLDGKLLPKLRWAKTKCPLNKF